MRWAIDIDKRAACSQRCRAHCRHCVGEAVLDEKRQRYEQRRQGQRATRDGSGKRGEGSRPRLPGARRNARRRARVPQERRDCRTHHAISDARQAERHASRQRSSC